MNCNEIVKILDLILDCEATEKQKEDFFDHLDKCGPCLEHYELDKLFKDFIAKHKDKNCCSDELLVRIKTKISTLN